MNQVDKKTLEHLEWVYPNLDVVYMGTNNFGVKFKGMVFKSDLEKINQIGFEIENIQDWQGDRILDSGLIVTIKDRNHARGITE